MKATMKMRARFLALMTALALPCPVGASSPWTQERGGGFFQISGYSIDSYERLFDDDDGSFRTGREITDSTLEFYGEYGISDRLTLIGNLPFKFQESGKAVSNPTLTPTTIAAGDLSRLGNVRVGLRTEFIDRAALFSGQLDLEIPTGTFDRQTGLSTGLDAVTLTPTVSVGRGWGRFHAFGYLGAALRSDDFSHSRLMGAEGGVRLFGRLSVVGLIDSVESFEDGDVALPRENLETGLYVNDQEYLAHGVKLLLDLNDRWGVQFTSHSADSGNFVARSALTGVGLYYKKRAQRSVR